MSLEKMYLVKEVAEILRVNQTRVLNLIRDGDIVAINTSDPGRRPRWKISRKSLDDFCSERSSKPAEQSTSRRRKLPSVREFV